MMLPFTLTLVALCLISPHVHGSPVDVEDGTSVHVATRQDNSQTEPLPPTQDPFYTAPAGYEVAFPGDILRIRTAPGNLTTLLGANCSAAYNILYRTRNSQYRPDWAVTTVLVPARNTSTTTNQTGPASILSYQIPYDSAFLDASPSYALYGADGAASREDISTGLARGWLVNVPDYEGPLASFTAGVQSGHATIDSIRAVLNASTSLGPFLDNAPSFSDRTGTKNGTTTTTTTTTTASMGRFALWGYSGGALASEWAAELQGQYAPELQAAFKGAALGGLTPNVTSVLLSVNGDIEAGLIPPSVLGLSSQVPAARDFLVARLRPEGAFNATGFLAALNYTLDEAILAYAFQDMGDYFVGGLADLLGPVPTRLTQRDGIMGYHGVPQVPLYVYKAIADEVSVVNDTDALVERYCNIGANILYDRNTVGGHSAELTNGKPAALAFLESVLSGTNATGLPDMGCAVNIVTVNITDSPLRRRGVPGGLLEYEVL